MSTNRRRLAPGRSWPLRRSLIESVLAEHGAPHLTKISGMTGVSRSGGAEMTVRWHPGRPGYLAGWGGGPKCVELSFPTVASSERAAAERALVIEALPALANSLRCAPMRSDALRCAPMRSDAPEGWKVLLHHRTWTWNGERVEESGDDVP